MHLPTHDTHKVYELNAKDPEYTTPELTDLCKYCTYWYSISYSCQIRAIWYQIELQSVNHNSSDQLLSSLVGYHCCGRFAFVSMNIQSLSLWPYNWIQIWVKLIFCLTVQSRRSCDHRRMGTGNPPWEFFFFKIISFHFHFEVFLEAFFFSPVHFQYNSQSQHPNPESWRFPNLFPQPTHFKLQTYWD